MDLQDPQYEIVCDSDNNKLTLSSVQFVTERAYKVYLEGRDRDGLLRHQASIPASVFKEQMSEWRHDCAIGTYSWLSPLCQQSFNSPECMEELLWLNVNQKIQLTDRAWFHDFLYSKSKIPIIDEMGEKLPQAVLGELKTAMFEILNTPKYMEVMKTSPIIKMNVAS